MSVVGTAILEKCSVFVLNPRFSGDVRGVGGCLFEVGCFVSHLDCHVLVPGFSGYVNGVGGFLFEVGSGLTDGDSDDHDETENDHNQQVDSEDDRLKPGTLKKSS